MSEQHIRGRATARPAAALSIAALAFLSACGGDASSDGSAPPPVANNHPPAFSSANTVTVLENSGGTVYQAAATDPNGDALTYSISGGADAKRFTISAAGQLTFITPPNYDLPTDSDGNNVYQVEIAASDGKATTTLALSLTVTNSKEGIAVHRIATGFTSPVAISPVSDTALLVAEKLGAVYLFNPQAGTKTLLVQIENVGAVGVVSLAAAPTFASDGSFFAMYTTKSGYLLINHYLRNPAGPTYPDNYGAAVSVNAPQYPGGGWLGFNAAGDLLAATSDGGGVGDPTGSAQNDSSQLGKVLRIANNPDPFAGAAPKPFLISTLAKGLHQPNGGSRVGDSFVFADHGQDIAEELDLLAPGAVGPNYGWPFQEGTHSTQGTASAGLTAPALEYLRNSGLRTGQAIIGGGLGPTAIASLRNQYVFADGSGAIFTIDTALLTSAGTRAADVVERRDADFTPDQGTIDHPVAITPGSNGALFILDADGEIFRVDGG